MDDVYLSATGAIEIANLTDDLALWVAPPSLQFTSSQSTRSGGICTCGSRNREVRPNESLAGESALDLAKANEESWGARSYLE